MPRNAVKKSPSTQRVEEHASAKRSAPTGVQLDEALLTGAGTEEQRRLLRKTTERRDAERHPDLPAGLHSAGSFTGENEKKNNG
ncbi:hypothetical protein [Alloacidobacterium sp.]|uniref:hypothetical protein n=1 Tax=Alloacidobacterium sp. TaxID=2951999 RepID=UPI002D285323|nr:hypothetical protein [Alloacidobacterium sp.]HYK35852.1 hypothetical protein [Alloacidobacterium sp.]